MALDYINEAFKKLALIEESVFDSSIDGINRMSDFVEKDDDTIRVIDSDAESESDIAESYIGKVIVDCNICHSHIFENKEDITIDDEGIVNIDKTCPYCGSEDGFVIVGEIRPYGEQSSEEQDTDLSTEETEEPIEEGLLGAVGLGLAAGAASAVGNKITSNIIGEDKEDNTEAETLDKRVNESISNGTAEGGSLDTAKRPGGQTKGSGTNFNALEGKKTKKIKAGNLKPGMITDTGKVLTVTDQGWINGKQQVEIGYGGIGARGSYASDLVDVDKEYDVLDENMSSTCVHHKFNEDFKEVSITTENQKMEMTSDENGKVTVTTEPIETQLEDDSEVTVSPVSDETQEEILANNDIVVDDNSYELDSEDQPTEEDVEMDISDVDEESMDELGESYLRKIYENVKSFKTSSVAANDSALIVEGVITFDSGVQKKTGFIFEAKDINTRGQVRFTGYNKQLTESANAFTLVGKIDNKKLFVESLKYNYLVNDNIVRGVVRRK